MKKQWNYPELCPGDIVGTTRLLSPFAIITRMTCAGVKNAFNPKIATHVRVIMGSTKLLYALEMQWPKKPNLHLVDLKGTEGETVFVKRSLPLYAKYQEVNDWLISSHSMSVRYDLKELLKFWNLAQDDSGKKWICSDLPREMFRHFGVPYDEKFNDKVSPYDWQTTKNLVPVKWWR